MNFEIIATFEPLQSGWGWDFWLATLIALAAGGGLWFLLSGKPASWSNNIRMLVAMLAFFALLISGGTAFFTGWVNVKNSPIVMYEEQMETPYGMLRYDDIRQINFEVDQQTAAFNANIKRGEPIRFLMIQGSGTMVVALSEKDYPIDAIVEKLGEIMELEKAGE